MAVPKSFEYSVLSDHHHDWVIKEENDRGTILPELYLIKEIEL